MNDIHMVLPLKTVLELSKALAAAEGFLEGSIEKADGAARLVDDYIRPALTTLEGVFDTEIITND